jgi:hypothetical protein
MSLSIINLISSLTISSLQSETTKTNTTTDWWSNDTYYWPRN